MQWLTLLLLCWLQADSTVLAEEGLAFMKEMLELAQNQPDSPADPRTLQILTKGNKS